jgi:hypothetical protein
MSLAVMPPSAKPRVLIHGDHWTAFRNEIFEEELADLKENNAAALYAVLYDRACHNKVPIVKATITELSKWAGVDARVAANCVKELRRESLIHKKSGSVDRSRTQLPRWKVPLAKPDLRHGGWTPVPRILMQQYIRAYPNAVLLLLLLRFQSMSWKDYCWPGVPKMSSLMGWSPTRVRDALKIMATDEEWDSLGNDLLRPLSVTRRPYKGRLVAHYRVRVVRYEADKQGRKIVRISRRFRKHFTIPSLGKSLE